MPPSPLLPWQAAQLAAKIRAPAVWSPPIVALVPCRAPPDWVPADVHAAKARASVEIAAKAEARILLRSVPAPARVKELAE